MTSNFLHELSNLVAIVSGKVRQANKLILEPADNEKLVEASQRLNDAKVAIDRMVTMINLEKTQTTEQIPNQTISLKGRTILIVDDEPGYREVLADEFLMVDATILQAENGTKAFELAQNNKIDAIISDIRMADGNGIELLANIKTLSPYLPVVLLITGHADFELSDAYSMGAEAIFSKPCDLDRLVESVYLALLEPKHRWVRKFERLPNDFVVEFEPESLLQTVKGRAINLGRGGMFVACEGPHPNVGSRVSFRIQSIPQNFEGIGLCRWRRETQKTDGPKGFGIEFQYLTEASLDLLCKVLQRLSQKPFIPKQ